MALSRFKTVDVTIREGMKFHDGKPLTSGDVKFTFDLMIKHKAPYFKTCLGPVKSVEVIDLYKIRFHLEKAYAPFVTQTLTMIPLLPKHVWEKLEKPKEYQNSELVYSFTKIFGDNPQTHKRASLIVEWLKNN